MKNSTPDRYKDTDLGSFCQKEPVSSSPQPPQSQNSPKTDPPSGVDNRVPPDPTVNQNSQPDHTDKPVHKQPKPPAVPLQPNQQSSTPDEREVFSAKQKTIEQIVLEVWDENERLFVGKGAGFRKDFTVKVLERLVPPEYREHFNYETIEAALPFLCCLEDPNRVLRLIVHDGRITLPKELQEKTAKAVRLYYDYYANQTDENSDHEGNGDAYAS